MGASAIARLRRCVAWIESDVAGICTALVVCISLMVLSTSEAAERWFLMSRHGDCTEVGVLKRKVPDLVEVTGPDAFVDLMRRKGYEATATRISVATGKAYEVRVPKKELSLIFVTSEMCTGRNGR